MLLKSYHHLHPLFKVQSPFVHRIDEVNNFKFFEMVVNTSDLTKELINRKLLIFKKYLLDAKDIKCPLKWWKKHETMLSSIGFLIKQILGIIGSQIEMKNVFSLIKILINLKRCRLQLDNLEKWIFMNKNWLNDARMACKPLNNLVTLINSKLDLKQELNEFESSFEQHEWIERDLI